MTCQTISGSSEIIGTLITIGKVKLNVCGFYMPSYSELSLRVNDAIILVVWLLVWFLIRFVPVGLNSNYINDHC